ncbi:MAG: TetR/AcrR family transcriptional regulator [Pseudomonadota bacterium]
MTSSASSRRNGARRGPYKPGQIRDRNFQLIIDAAEYEFARHGYHGTSTQKIADRAGIAKANIHYYFNSKSNLYLEVLDNIISLWNDFLDDVSVEDDPAEVLDKFVRRKVALSFSHPQASRVFAVEIIQGAPHIKEYIRTRMRKWVTEKAGVLRQWSAEGRMADIDPVHLIFLIWSSTQHYADFETQVLTILNRKDFDANTQRQVADFLSATILRACGLSTPAPLSPRTS